MIKYKNNDNKCAPTKTYYDGSCFTLESLQLIAKKYNNMHENKILITDNKLDMVDKLTKIFSTCDNQLCWLRSDIIRSLKNDDINNNTFRPHGPSNTNEWLNTKHIDDVMEQYVNYYNDFIFLGAVPSDFAEIPMLGLNNIDFDDFVSNNHTKIALIINLDTHNMPGSHWVALYTDLIKKQLYYFDSVGYPPQKRIKRFNNKIINYMYKQTYNDDIDIIKILNKIKKQKIKNNKIISYFSKLLKEFDIKYNHIQHQQLNTECGVYSINFILRLLKGELFNDIIYNITPDKEVEKCRNVYFN